MALPSKRFDGVLAGMTIYDMREKLDYEIESQEDRVRIVEAIVNDDRGLPNTYFREFFEPRTEDGVDTSYYKVNVNKCDFLSHEINVFQQIEKMADYILFAPDAKPLTDKVQYNMVNEMDEPEVNYYMSDRLDKRMAKELSLEGVATKAHSDASAEGCDSDVIGEVIDFLVRKGTNYKKEIKQSITLSDIANLTPIREYEEYIEYMKQKIVHIEETNGDKKDIYMLRKHISLCKQDQLYLKDMLRGTIYFNAPLPDSGEPEFLEYTHYSDFNHVKALLKFGHRSLKSDIGHLIFDLENLIERADLTDRDREILTMWSAEDSTEQTIADEMEISQQMVNKLLSKIIRRIIAVYKDDYLNHVFLNYLKGEYKQCNKCGEVKLISMFDKDSTKKMGVKNICKACRKT